MRRWLRLWLFALLLPCALPAAAPAADSYQLFEAGQSRPLALSPDGARLFAVNTPDDELEIFDLDPSGAPVHAGSLHVGMRPVAVAARTDDEVWVVNHLSDSVSVVRLSPVPHVERTLLVGDEPQDLVFAGPQSGGAFTRAFVSAAHRGQNHDRVAGHDDPAGQALLEGQGRADVWVFDALDPGDSLGGDPLAVLGFFGDRPRALAASPDGARVFVGVFRSGNRTTAVGDGLVCNTTSARMNSNALQPGCTVNGVAVPGGYPPPHKNQAGVNRPETGLVLQFDRPGGPAGQWSDELGRSWNAVVKLDLPDRDVFEIDADALPLPLAVDGSASCVNGAGCWARVGTSLFSMLVNPANGKLYVANSEAQNQVRFEGNGVHAAGPSGKLAAGEPPTLQGNLAHARISVLDGASVLPRHLNKHLDYALRPAPASDRAKSVAGPLGMALDAGRLYVAAFGSGRIAVYDTAELEADSFDPDQTDPGAAGFVAQIPLAGGGPSGLALGAGKLYALTRFDNTLRVVDLASQLELTALAVALHSPEPSEIRAGRPFLYDAAQTSSNGEASCASCHLFGDMDDLVWDLGDPDGSVAANANPFNPVIPPQGDPLPRQFHPMKGPMATQSLRGLANMGPQHWRGDRQGSEIQAFEAFNAAFPGLLGRETPLAAAEMTAFREFALLLRYPPNPIRRLDDTLRSDEAAGAALYTGPITDQIADCHSCHILDPAAGHFGGDGRTIFDAATEHIKIPHLRNQYQKVGMFGMSQPAPINANAVFTGDFTHQGPQVRGTGYLHDGSVDGLMRFFGNTGFTGLATQQQEAQMTAFMLVFPSDFAPAVGQQVTLHAGNAADAATAARIDLLIAQARASASSQILGPGARACELVAKGVQAGKPRGHLFTPGPPELFLPDDGGAGVSDAALRAQAGAPGQALTYTCVPPGSGQREARDRDLDLLLNAVETNTGVFVDAGDTGTHPARADSDGDGYGDGDEVAQSHDPTDPRDYPGAPPPGVPALPPLAKVALFGLLLVGGALSVRKFAR